MQYLKKTFYIYKLDRGLIDRHPKHSGLLLGDDARSMTAWRCHLKYAGRETLPRRSGPKHTGILLEHTA